MCRSIGWPQRITILKKSITFQSMGRAFIGQVSNRDQWGVCQLRVWVKFWRFGNSIWAIVRMRKNSLISLRKAMSRIPIWQMRLAFWFISFLVNYGLVIVDGDDARLKQEFVPYLQRECEEQLIQKGSETTMEKLNDALQTKSKAQVNPREINLFYMGESGRQRIEKTKTGYGVVDTAISFSKQELIKEIKSYPERFSPNVLFRPIYQEVVLPNLVTVGGGSELAYWLQLRAVFSSFDLPIPMLKLRSSILLIGR